MPRIRRPPRRAALALGALLAAAGVEAAGAQEVEEILSYAVDIDVRAGGSMLVTEDITVRALGQEIRRGIYRDFPTGFPRWSGLGRIEAPFAVRSVSRDGGPEPYRLTSIGGPLGRSGVRIQIGQEEVLLEPGVHRYTIAYETDRWIDFGTEADRLFWNVTGNGWGFAIREASAVVRVEGLDEAPTLRAWTGPEGSTASDARASWDPVARQARFETTAPLAEGEGLTIDVGFPSGRLAPPSEEQTAAWFALDWGGWIEGGYAVLFVVAVYLLMWRSVGVDPAPRTVGIRSEPPKGFSPAALGYLERRGYATSQMAAALVSMAMKGAVRIERSGDTWTLHEVDGSVDLSAEERAVFDELLGSRPSIALEQSQHVRLAKAVKALRGKLARQLEHEYFVNNRRWFLAGLAVSVVGFAALAWRWRFDVQPVALFLGVWLTGWTVGVVTLGVRIGHLLRAARRERTPALWGGAAFLSLFALPFFAAEIGVSAVLFTMVPAHLLVAALAIGATNVAFYHLLERPTLRGRGVLDQLDGFRAWLVGDPDRRRPGADGAGAEVFERFLPHAIALGLEQRWATGFGDALKPRTKRAHDPFPWYHFHDHETGRSRAFDASTFASSLGSSLASTLSAASSPPASGGGGGGSSGGGGGSSGGGGGGGGGGGW